MFCGSIKSLQHYYGILGGMQIIFAVYVNMGLQHRVHNIAQ